MSRVSKLWLAVSSLVLGLAGLEASGAPSETTAGPQGPREIVLDNGMRILVVERPGQPLVAAAWAVGSGSGDERPGSGASHLIEHLLFGGSQEIGTRDWQQEKQWMAERDALEERLRGIRQPRQPLGSESVDAVTRVRPGSEAELTRGIARVERSLAAVRIEGELAKHYAEAGALGVEGQTNKDASLYSAMIPVQRLELWFWLESDRLLRPVFRGLYRELDVIEAERAQRLESSPFGVALERFDGEFWGAGHPYSWSIDGLPGGLRGLRRSDLRRHFQDQYRPCNLLAAVVGDVDVAVIEKLAQRYFGRLPGSAEDCVGAVAERRETASARRGRLDVTEGCDCRSQVELRFETVPFAHPDAVVLDVVAGLLNGRAGRLHRALVQEQGIAFTASSRHSHLRRAGTFSLFAQAASAAPAATTESPSSSSAGAVLENALFDQIDRLRTEPVSDLELEKVHNQIAMDAARQGKSSLGLALRLLVYETVGSWKAIDQRPRESAAVTAADVRRVVERYLGRSRVAVLRLEPGAASSWPHAALEPSAELTVSAPAKPSVAPTRTGLRPPTPEPAIPRRPELLRFRETAFPSPDGSRHRHQLANGIPVYVVEDHTVPIVDVVLALPVGEFQELPEQVGVSSLAASMLRRAGTERRSPREVDDLADRLAIEINSVGGRYRSGVSLECSTAVLDQALELWSEVLLHPRFDADSVARARSSLRSRVAQEAAVDPGREWNRLLRGPEHFLARRMTLDHVERLQSPALRSFYLNHWGPRGAAIAVSGDVEAKAVVAQLDRLLGGWQAEATASTEATVASSPSSRSSPGVFQIAGRSGASSTAPGQLFLGHEGVQRTSWDDSEMFSLLVMAEILGGGGAISRLSSRLRAVEGLVYQVDASFGIGLLERGVFEVAVSVLPDNAPRVAEIVVDELNRLRRAAPPAIELDLARRALSDGFPLLFDSAESRAGRFAEDALLGRPHGYWSLYRRAVEKVTAADVRAAARKFLHPERLRVLWVGPRLDEEDWRSLGLGPVKTLDAPQAPQP